MSKNSVWGVRPFLFIATAIVALLLITPAAQAAPANDDFASAAPITPAAGAFGSNLEATKEAGEPNHAGDPGGHSVWYSWTPSKSGSAGVNTSCFDQLDPLIAVYTGASVGALTEVASNLNGPPPLCFSVTSEVEFEVTAGTTYWIAVDGRGGDEGSFSLTLRSAPANDDFAAATAIEPTLPQSVPGSTKFATRQVDEPEHAGDPGGHSVWFAWAPTQTERVEISTCTNFMTSGIDTVLAVYTGAALDSLTPVVSNDDVTGPPGTPGCSGLDSGVELDAVAGTTYRIAVDGASGTSTNFSLRIRGRPQNDDFANPQTIGPTLPSSVGQISNRYATEEAGEPEHAGVVGVRSVWFTWTPAQSGRVSVTTCTHEPWGSPDTMLAVYTGSAVDALTEVAANDDNEEHPDCAYSDSGLIFDAVAGTTYRIAADSKEPVVARFDLNFEWVGANDAFATPQTISPGLPSFEMGVNRGALKELGEPNHAGDPGGHSLWYSWTPDQSGPAVLTVCPYGESGPDTLLAVYTGSAVDALTEVAANDDSPASCRSFGSVVKLNAVAGMTYRIAVDSREGTGRFALELTPPDGNDDFADAAVLAPEPMATGGSSVFATKQAGEPNHAGDPGGHSLWWSWTPNQSGPVDITACGKASQVDTVLAVYTGAALNTLAPVASNDDASLPPSNEFCEGVAVSEVVFDAVAGTTYKIAVDTKGVEGRFGIAFERAPQNDDFAAASTLNPLLPSYAGGVVKLASKQAGEPNHAGDPGGHSVWYSWTPTVTTPVNLSACTYTGSLDTLLAVYTGSSLAGLTPVASDDDGTDGCRATDSQVVFDAIAGTPYLIAVDGKGGSTGGFQFSLEGTAANDSFAKPQTLGGYELPVDTWSSNRFATKQLGEPNHAGNLGGASVWFKWTAPRTGEFSVDTCGSSFDTVLAVYRGGAVDNLTTVDGNDDGSGKCGPQSKLSFTALEGTPYRIAVDGKDGAEGGIRLYISGPPANDDFAAPETIPGTRGWYWPGSTLLATKEAGEPNHAGDPGGHSVWYSWTPKKAGTTELNACSDSFDLELEIYTGSSLPFLNPVATTDLGSGECDQGRALRFAATEGTPYYFAVDGAGGDSGHFQLHLTGSTAVLRTLSVAKAGTGTGTVSSTPAGIACGTDCNEQFESGTAITLTATPAAGSTFAGWSGGGCSGTGSCQLTLGADTTVTATFQLVDNGGGGGGGPGPGNPPAQPPKPPKPLKCKPGFKKVKVKGKQKCVKKKKPGKHKAKGKGQKRGQK